MKKRLDNVFKQIGLKTIISDVENILPFAYQKKYIIQRMILADESYLIIKEKRRSSLESFVKQAEFICREYQTDYILLFNSISNDEKTMLLKAKIPFLDYQGNLFMPKLGMILNKEIEKIENKRFTTSEQLIFIYILISKLNDQVSIEADLVAKQTQLSIATVFRALNKFVQLDWLCSNHGFYSFNKDKSYIFDEAQPYLFNPVKKTIYLDKNDFSACFKSQKFWGYAGTFALSQLSNLVENQAMIAMSVVDFKQMNQKKSFEFYEKNLLFNPELIQIQLWYYSPMIFKNHVDLISLFLSLRESDDPRIEKELQKIIKDNLEINISTEE